MRVLFTDHCVGVPYYDAFVALSVQSEKTYIVRLYEDGRVRYGVNAHEVKELPKYPSTKLLLQAYDELKDLMQDRLIDSNHATYDAFMTALNNFNMVHGASRRMEMAHWTE